MSLPELFSRTLQPLDPDGTLAPAAALLPGVGRTLEFDLETQSQTEWCWAAVGVGVSKFYKPAGNSLTQCRLANTELERDDCCGGGGATDCNVPTAPETVLAKTGNLDESKLDMMDSPASFQDVQNEILNGRPLCCGIGWIVGGGHLVVLHGASTDNSGGVVKQWVAVADPKYGPSDYLVEDFTDAYRQGAGQWLTSYFTRG